MINNRLEHVEKVINSIQAVMENSASEDVLSYAINGRELQRYSKAELIKVQKDYMNEYYRLKRGGEGRGLFKTILMN